MWTDYKLSIDNWKGKLTTLDSLGKDIKSLCELEKLTDEIELSDSVNARILECKENELVHVVIKQRIVLQWHKQQGIARNLTHYYILF